MDEATQTTKRLVDDLLGTAERRWGDLPRVEGIFQSWDPEDQEIFVLKWAIEDDRLVSLQRRRAAGEMTAEQAARHDEVKRLAEEKRPTIDRLADR